MTSVDHLHGNTEVIAALEKYLEVAREGRMTYLAIVAHQEPGSVMAFFGGSDLWLASSRKAVGNLGDMMEAEIVNCTLPPRDESLGADFVCYPYATAPASYDFITWLVDAEMTRIREGAPAPLKVAFWLGRDGATGLNTPSRVQMLENVIQPALALIGAVEDPRALGGRCKAFYTCRDISAAARAGEHVPILRAPADAIAMVRDALREHPAPVTITLRECDHWPHRNSNIEAWTRFAEVLRGRGQPVIFVRDTKKATETIRGVSTFPLASTDLHIRMALYETATANLFVSNGPLELAMFSDRPWLQFMKVQDDDHPCGAETPSFLRENMGLEPGGQYPWSGPKQQIVWGPDDFETILAAWEKLAVR